MKHGDLVSRFNHELCAIKELIRFFRRFLDRMRINRATAAIHHLSYTQEIIHRITMRPMALLSLDSLIVGDVSFRYAYITTSGLKILMSIYTIHDLISI